METGVSSALPPSSADGQWSQRCGLDLSPTVDEIRARVVERLRALGRAQPSTELHGQGSIEGLLGEPVPAYGLSVILREAARGQGRQFPVSGIERDGELSLGSISNCPAVSLDEVIEIAVAFLAALISSPPPNEIRTTSAARHAALTARQQAVLRLVADGLSNKEIAQSLKVTVPTVKTHLFWAMEKLGAENRAHAAVLASQRRLL